MNRLDKRLSCVASLVRLGSRVADIGTDHAYLPVYLVESSLCPFAVASDIGEGPLEAARHTVLTAGLESKISCRLGDGLSTVKAGEVDDVVIAGMGGETIVAILDAAPFVKDPSLRLIMQPMTHGEDLRRWLLENGFSVVEEHLVQDKHHLYPVMAAVYSGEPIEDELACYAGFFEAKEGRAYREMMAEHLSRRVAGYTRAGESDRANALLSIIKQLRDM